MSNKIAIQATIIYYIDGIRIKTKKLHLLYVCQNKNFLRGKPSIPRRAGTDKEIQKRYKKLRLSTFLAGTIGYALYHICRTSLNVMKGPILDSNVLNATQLGVIGSIMLITYAVGRFVNGLLADHSNIKRFMATGMVIVTITNLAVGLLGWVTTETATPPPNSPSTPPAQSRRRSN